MGGQLFKGKDLLLSKPGRNENKFLKILPNIPDDFNQMMHY